MKDWQQLGLSSHIIYGRGSPLPHSYKQTKKLISTAHMLHILVSSLPPPMCSLHYPTKHLHSHPLRLSFLFISFLFQHFWPTYLEITSSTLYNYWLRAATNRTLFSSSIYQNITTIVTHRMRILEATHRSNNNHNPLFNNYHLGHCYFKINILNKFIL